MDTVPVPHPVICPHGHHVGWYHRPDPDTIVSTRMAVPCPECSHGCVLCGEPREEGLPYCWQCAKLRCPHCGFVHDLNGLRPCDPPPQP
jgi:hypothetical protein